MNSSVVSIDNLVKRYGENVAVDHFSLDIKEGEILGLLGPNGSGKQQRLIACYHCLHLIRVTFRFLEKK